MREGPFPEGAWGARKSPLPAKHLHEDPLSVQIQMSSVLSSSETDKMRLKVCHHPQQPVGDGVSVTTQYHLHQAACVCTCACVCVRVFLRL